MMLTSAFIVKDEIKNAMENPGKNFFEGDIILRTKKGRNGITNMKDRWVKNQAGIVYVPYAIQPNTYSKIRKLF